MSSSPASPQPRLRTRLAYWAILVLVAAGLCELASLGVYRWVAGQGFSFADLGTRRSEVLGERNDAEPDAAQAAMVPDFIASDVIHPYLGYVVDPSRAGASSRVHPQGLPGIEAAFDVSPNTIVVGIFGGSVAAQTVDRASTELAEGLSRVPAFAGRRIRIAKVALGGYKQPQQALALAYLQMLGARFDVVIELDGFNEIVLPVVENQRNGVFFAYPRQWHLRTAGLQETPVLREIGTITVMQSARRDLARFVGGSFLRHLVTPNVVWFLADRRLSTAIGRHRRSLDRTRTDRFLQVGPGGGIQPEAEAVLRRSTELWARGSVAMEALARARGSRYFHFLQPNQYVEGGKPLSGEELRIAINMTRGSYGPAARHGYPLLVARGRRFSEAGFPFEDLTRIFANETRTMYSDTCCHLNAEGHAIVAKRIAASIVERLAGQP